MQMDCPIWTVYSPYKLVYSNSNAMQKDLPKLCNDFPILMNLLKHECNAQTLSKVFKHECNAQTLSKVGNDLPMHFNVI